MIKSLLSALSSKGIPDEDITEVWNRFHPHLRPYEGNASTTENGSPTLFANLRLAGDQWIEMAEIIFERASGRFVFTAENRRKALAGRPELASAAVDAVDARLWFAQPTLINIEPTTRCNFKCWYCVGRHMKQDDIRLEDLATMLDNFPGLQTIALVGEGEPLMHKDFFTMARMAQARKIRVMIISNGSAFSQSVIRQLCETEVAYVSISIDSYDAATFASSRLEGNLEKIWQGIRKLRDYRDANGYSFPKISLKGTLFQHTKDQLPGIVDLAKEHGVEIFESFQALNPMHNYVRIYPQEQLPELQTVDAIQASINRDSQYALTQLQSFQDFCADQKINFFPTAKSNPKRRNCNETWIYSLLSGDITPCCQIKTPPSADWNIFKRNLNEIMSDPAYENMRFNLWNGIFPDYCAGCWKTRQG